MKLKNWVLWLCVVVLLAGEFFLFSANRQKDAALVQLREAKTEMEQLRSQLDQLKNSSVATLSTENARLRAENQGLTQKFPQLQAENNRLREQSQKLAQQLEAAHSAVQQQQQQLQQIQTDNQQAQQANSPPEPSVESPAAVVTQFNTCINHLRQIDAAKQEWALENTKTADAVPTALELLPYLKDSIFPMCPSGGAYTINAVGMPPTCSIPGHVLPQ
jgi:septal ring factor EnvC (AmiA/AmiB activator)